MVDYETFQKEWDDAIGEDGAREFEQWKRNSEMLRRLCLYRVASGQTEKEIAGKLGWTEEQVLNFEMSESQDIHFGNLLAYLSAIDMGMDIKFKLKNAPIEEDLAFHAARVNDLLKEIVEIAGDDKKMTEEVLRLIYSHSRMTMNMVVELTTMFPNKDAVMQALEKILPPEYKPSQYIKESNTGVGVSIVAGNVLPEAEPKSQLSFSGG